MATTEQINLARYQQLVERADEDLRLAQHGAKELGLPYKRMARLQRARRELREESDDVTRDRARVRREVRR